jgi:hypothetical protein
VKLRLEIEPGETLVDACEAAQDLADKCEWPITFDFNGVRCVAEVGGVAELLAERQSEAQRTVLLVRSYDGGGDGPELIQEECA